MLARCYVAGGLTLVACWFFLGAAMPGGSDFSRREPYYAALEALSPLLLGWAAAALPALAAPMRWQLGLAVLGCGVLCALAGFGSVLSARA